MSGVIDEWVDDLLQQCTRWNIVFVHLGDAYPLAREAIRPQVEEVVTVGDYLTRPSQEATLRLVSNVEELIEPGAATLGQLRERVIADRDAGVRVILLSRRPKIAFPTVPGSQVLRDAKLVPPPLYGSADSWRFGEEATNDGVPEDVVVAQALRELGEAACAGLDALLFEDGRESQELSLLDEALQEALMSAGMVVMVDGELQWALTDPHPRVRTALSDVIAGMRKLQTDFAHVSGHCWTVERVIKQALRARAKTLWGDDWRHELLGTELSKNAFLRANSATYPSAERLEDLRDPLEWLSLAETLDLRTSSGVGSLGMNQPMWDKLRSELLPVKDRVERSQLMRKGDVDAARRWSTLVSQRLSTTGSRSPAESFELATLPQRELLEALRTDLGQNPRLRGDVEKDLMSLVLATVKFLAHTLDEHPEYTAPFTSKEDAPVERDLQDAFKAYLDMSDLAGRSAVEVSSIAGGRADVVLYFNDGTRYVTEVKREFTRKTAAELEDAYLPQEVAYQSANVPFGQLLVLDLTSQRDAASERLDQSLWITHSEDADGAIIASTVVAVVRGNRPTPSKRK